MRGAAFTLLACSVALAQPARVGASGEVDRIIARVGTRPIWASELDEQIESSRGATTEAKALDDLIDTALELDWAEAQHLSVNDGEVDRAIQAVKDRNRLSDAELDRSLAEQHLTRATWREQLRRHVLVLKVENTLLNAGTTRAEWIAEQRAVTHIERRTPARSAPAVRWDALTGPVREVAIGIADRALAKRVEALVSGERAQTLDRTRLRLALERVAALPGVQDVEVRGVQLANGVKLIVDLTPTPIMHGITTREVGRGEVELAPQYTTLAGRPLDVRVLEACAVTLRIQYENRGYPDVAVAWHAAKVAPGAVDIVVEVTPGTRFTIAGIEFRGNAHASPGELQAALAGTLVAGAPWRLDHAHEASERLAAYYSDHGFVNAVIDSHRPNPPHGPMVIEIREGDQFHVGDVAVRGMPAGDAPALFGVKRGDVYRESDVRAAVQRLREHAHAEVSLRTAVDDKTKLVNLTLEVIRKP
jgi:hemolysin activation/secretion protein